MIPRIFALVYVNIVLSFFYSLISLFVFLSLQVVAFSTPFILGLFIFQKLFVPQEPISQMSFHAYAVLAGGFLGSIMILINILKGLKQAMSTPVYDNAVEDHKIFSLVKSVANDVGVSPFQAVYLNSELDISTFYIGSERFLNLSVVALMYLTEEEVKAVIAHECAHHHNNAMLLNRTHYRAVILSQSFATAVEKTASLFSESLNKNVLNYHLMNYAVITLLPVMFCICLYYYFLRFLGTLIKDSEYEYYCDSIAAKYAGGNILASALQKVFDLHIASHRFSQRLFENDEKVNCASIEHMYIEGLNQEFLYIRNSNIEIRTKAAQKKTSTHPPLVSRLERAQAISSKIDSSQPLLSQVEVEFWLKKLSGDSVLDALRQESETAIKNKNKLNAIAKAQEIQGSAMIILNRRDEAFPLYRKLEIFINKKSVGTINMGGKKCFCVSPGLNTIYVQSTDQCEELELILSGGEQIEIECWASSWGGSDIYISLKSDNQ